MNILNITSNYNFLKTIADFSIDIAKDYLYLSKITILLPSRRSCNELKRIFLEQTENEAIILPKIQAIGDIDYDDILLKSINEKDLENFSCISSNISRIKYKILLIKELLKWSKESNKPLFKNLNVEQASNFALEFEKFLNEVNKNQLSLNSLDTIVDEEYSEHWQQILDFLKIFGKKWNKFLENNNIISTFDFKTKMIEFNTKFFETHKPDNPIIFAGINSNIKSSMDLIKSLIKYDNCYFIFKGLDTNLNDNEWKKIDVFHPQFLLKNLLEKCIQCKRSEVRELIFGKNRIVNDNFNIISTYSMLPSSETYKWHDNLNINNGIFNHITKIDCNDNFEEINIISYILKYNVIEQNKTMAIICPDENFANTLEINLKSINLDVNNAYGNKISKTEFVKFLFLILDVVKTDFDSIALLSLLKHNFSLFNYQKEELNKLILLLEDRVLRGSDKINYKKIINKIKYIENDFEKDKLNFFINNIYNFIDPLINLKTFDFQSILKFHVELAEKIASNNNINGHNIFWNNELNGNELLNFFQELFKESKEYGNIEDLNEYSYLLNYLISENSYSDKYSIRPTVNIISPQEVKLINYDLIIISNLNEGKFPIHIPADLWMSKSMRKKFNLPAKEESIGNSAYDFIQYLNNKEVILTRSIKEDGVPTIKSRFLLRLETFLECQNLQLKENEIWKKLFNRINNVDDIESISRPKPTPELENRPKELFATDIEKLINNPYDIYARKILKLKKKENFYNINVYSTFGTAVHKAIENYIKNYNNMVINVKTKNNYLYEQLVNYGKQSFDENFTNDTTKDLFFIRFLNIANWFINEDERIRNLGFKISAEKIEKYELKDLNFTISAKIDRIEENDFGILNIGDYKTGITPSNNDVKTAKKPQLIIEAIILENKFKNKKIEKLVYWTAKGKDENKLQEIDCNIKSLIEKGENGLNKLIAYFNIYENSYIATCYELRQNKNSESNYKHLSRVDEWGYN